MTNMITYPKIKILGSPENKGILHIGDELCIQEKIDGANFRFMVKKGVIYFGSHKRELGNEEITTENAKQFKGCMDFIIKIVNRKELKKFENAYIFFGESCSKHTVTYNWGKMPLFLGFDVYDMASKKFLSVYEAKDIFTKIGLTFVPIKHTGLFTMNSTVDNLMNQEQWSSVYAEDGQAEGIVIKNVRKQIYAKIVDAKFKEKNKEAFRKPKKYCENDNELFISTYLTEARVEKCIFKLIDDNHTLDRKMMKELPMLVWYDIWEEEWKEIVGKRWTISFHTLKKNMAKFCLTTLDRMIINQTR